jgi:hypothetical protein
VHGEVVVGPATANKGKDIRMAIIFSKASSCRTSILLGLLAGLAALFPGSLRALMAIVQTSPPQGTSEKWRGDEKTIMQIAFLTETQVGVDEADRAAQLSGKQKHRLLKSNFEAMKRDAGELAGLAKALQEELNKSNENVLSLDVVDKADKIEKLARKIKGTARGF